MKYINKKSGLIFLIIIIFSSACFIYWYNMGSKPDGILEEDLNKITPKKYEINEYTTMLINDSQMAEKLLNDYLFEITSNLNNAYDLLDNDYKINKFGSYDNFVNYLNEKFTSFTSVDKYYKKGKIYYIYDKNGNMFIFSTKGVMSYKVYFDEDTVEITNLE